MRQGGWVKESISILQGRELRPREAVSHSDEALQRPCPNKLTKTLAWDKEQLMAAGEPVFTVLLEWPAHPTSPWRDVAVALQNAV